MRLLQHSPFIHWADPVRFFGPPREDNDWVPEFDIRETDEAFVLQGDIPGLTQKDLEVRVEDSVLTVSGERARPAAEARFSRRERPHGKFRRSFRLGDGVDDANVKASCEGGVLELTLPKHEPEDNSRLIPVN